LKGEKVICSKQYSEQHKKHIKKLDTERGTPNVHPTTIHDDHFEATTADKLDNHQDL
jgi:hypothetical protein